MPFTRIDTGLYRFDNEEKSEHGYVVNLSRQGVQHVCRFADGVHGGKRAALDAARAWRDEIIAKHPHHSRHDYVQILRRNNTSGTPGVSARKDADGDITHWVAHWLMPGSDHKLSRKFALSEHGPARAKQLAIRAREAGVSGLVDDPWVRRESDRDPALAARRSKLAEAARAARANDWRLARVQVSRLTNVPASTRSSRQWGRTRD